MTARDRPLTKAELAELQKKLSKMSGTAVTDFYSAAHWRCEIKDGKAPESRHIQELVQAWRELRKWS